MDNRYLKILRRTAVLTIALAGTSGVYASGGGDMEPAGNDINNIQSLQRGAGNFVNYCSGCHSARYVRYNTVARDLEFSEDQVANNLMFNADKMFETIQSSMSADDARRWFGQAPPDMSLIARAKGADYIYNFLKGFYLDPDSPTGVDNHVLEGTSMPHVLWGLQGYQNAVYHEEAIGDEGETRRVFDKLEAVTDGSISSEEYDTFVRDTVNFLAYISEPERSTRRKVGTWVIIYLLFFLIISVMLKKQIWKDVN